MNIQTIKAIAFGTILTTLALSVNAQKKYTEGNIVYTVNAMGQDVDGTTYFKPDSSSFSFQRGPASIKMISNTAVDYFAVLVDVPIANMKKAAISNPGEIEEAKDKDPNYTFAPTTDTKKIGDFNCKKYIAKDSKSGNSYDLWVTNDITAPANLLTRFFTGVSGVPVQFTAIQMGQPQTVTLKSISDAKVPAGSFGIPADYDKITMADLQAMGGRK